MQKHEQKQKKKYLIALEETRSVVALAAGILVFVCTLLCVFWVIDLFDAGMLQYFTLLSNLLSAVGAAFMIPYAAEGIRKKRFVLPRWVVLFQFAGAICVTITMVTALGLILPLQGAQMAFNQYNFWLHVVTPLATVVLFQCVESGVTLTKREMLLSMTPFCIYVVVYLVMVVLLGKWEDIYGAAVYLPAWASFLVMLALGLAVAAVLRRVQNRRAAQSWNRIARMWSEDLEPIQLLIEAFGLGRYIGAVCGAGELTVPLDIFKAMATRYDVSLEKLTKAYIKGALDAVEEKTNHNTTHGMEMAFMKRSISFLMAILMVLALTIATPMAAFAADDALDRAAVVQRLYELEGRPMVIQSVVFEDAAGTAWSNAATWAYGAGIVQGNGKGCFRGDRAVTRAELATMLYRYAQYKGIDVSVGEDTNILSYYDAFDLPAWSIPAFQWACGAGIIDDGNGYLLPGETVSEAELAAFLAKLGDSADPLSLWTEGAALKTELTAYMAAITDPASPDFIPVADRIAVFDMDGTVFCETDPVYFDHMLFLYRVTQDPDYKDRASEVEKEVAEKIQKEFIENGVYPAGMDVAHGQGVASAFAGMTLGEFDAYVQAFKQLPMPSYAGMTQGEAFYRPMVQMIEYLQANDFKVYIVSGTDRLIVRALFKDNILDIPPSQLIGSDELIVASHQGDADGLDYTFVEGDELILGGEFLIKNLKMNKVAVIAQEIGQQPVLSFGNSSGDGAMANYVISGNHHRALAFMLCCDDTVRENGSQSKADKMYDLCEKYGWIPISMRDDWTTIYGDGVTYLGADAAAAA